MASAVAALRLSNFVQVPESRSIQTTRTSITLCWSHTSRLELEFAAHCSEHLIGPTCFPLQQVYLHTCPQRGSLSAPPPINVMYAVARAVLDTTACLHRPAPCVSCAAFRLMHACTSAVMRPSPLLAYRVLRSLLATLFKNVQCFIEFLEIMCNKAL